jgi:hypothetical protein
MQSACQLADLHQIKGLAGVGVMAEMDLASFAGQDLPLLR